MPRQIKYPVRALALVSLISGTALADDAAMLRCRSITDSTARLACYDAIAITPAPPGAPAAAKTVPDQATQQATQRQQFGLENTPQPGAPPVLDAIESSIPGPFEGWRGNARFQLANGQVWQVTDGSSAFENLNNPKVKIRRGALGAFYLEIEGTNRSPRVRRLQ